MTTKHAPCQPTAEDTDLPLLVSRSMGTDSSILWATCWINHGPVQGLRNCRELPWTISSLFPFLPEQVWEVGPDVLAWALLEAPFREHGLCVCSSWSEVAQSLSKEGQLMYKSIRTGVPWIGGTSLCTRGDVGELGVHSALKALVIKITQLSHPAAGLSSTIVVQSLSHVQLFPTPWTAVCRLPCPSLYPRVCSNSCPLSWWCHLILCHLLLLLPSIFPSIRVFSNELAFCIKWPKYQIFSISPSNEYSRLISFRMTGLISMQSKGLSRVFSRITIRKHQFFSTRPSLWSNSHILTWLLGKS